ncbi:MAG TPA: SpoIIE family protein phosphatase [Desulfuromonadales bacterium]|nr:SpoIIE family protein phosphatase [Desulfuromonadales bacterium]
MISAGALSLCTLLYIALLFATAVYADRRREMGRSITSNAWIYALSFGIFHTSWTFYGNVGRVATVGIDFLAFYLGVTLIIFSWWYLLRKMVRISKEQNIVSIADFIASRFGKSLPLGALVTLFAVFCTLPYIALQLKGVADTFELLTASRPTLLPVFDTAFVVAMVFALFGILFGARHLDPSARHEGLVAAIALESVVKLVAMMAVGLFVVFGLFDGFGDICSRFLDRFPERSDLLLLGTDRVPYSSWLTLGVISMMAFMFLPHMFHIMVVENADEEHIRSAMWRFPLYMFLIELFIIPIALGGLLLHGGDTAKAEYFTLLLPLEADQRSLALLVFLGGFSGSTAMVMVAAVALATLILNHLVMPVVLSFDIQARDISGLLLAAKRLAILAVVFLGYLFYKLIGQGYALVAMGLISWVGATQFAPAMLGGLYWKRANRRGALLGMLLGFGVWFYTLILPTLVRSGWLPSSLLQDGPFGLAWLRPEALFGLAGLPTLPHALFWTLFFNIGAFLAFSLYTKPQPEEKEQADRFVEGFAPPREKGQAERISRAPTIVEFVDLMTKFVGEKRAHAAITDYVSSRKIDERGRLSEFDLADLRHFTEKTLAGSVGTAPARIILDHYLESRGSRMEEVFDIFGSVSISRKAGREQLGVLHEATRLVASGADLQTILDNILGLLQQQFKFELCAVRLLDPERQTFVVASQIGMSAEHLSDSERAPDMETAIGRTFLTNSALVVNDTDFLDIPFAAQVAHREGIKSFAHAPITIEGEPVGVLSVFSLSAKGIFTEEFVDLFANLTGQVGVALRNARQTEHLIAAREREREMEIARGIQLGLLPSRVPEIPGVAMAGICVPAREVGGDYYDFLPIGTQSVDLVIADVSGHNVGAAIIMTEVRTFIRSQAQQLPGAGAALRAIDGFLYEDLGRAELFITMAYLRYDAATRQLSFACAGHPPPLILRAGPGRCEYIDAEGLILGVKRNVVFEEKQVLLHPGDILLLYTDGITEAENGEGEFFGEGRLCSLVQELRHLSPAGLLEELLYQVRLFAGGRSFTDDVTLVVMRVEE